jgi:hypothetical protein
MKIETGRYYVLQSTEEAQNEKYIMLVLPRPDYLPEQLYRTETLGIHNMTMWQNDWLEEYFHREADPTEVETFVSERNKHGERLQGIGELVTGGFRIDNIEELPKLIDYLSQ